MTIPATGKPEDRARANIDRLLTAAGWLIQNRDSINIEAARGVAIREFPLAPGHGFADYLLYIDGYAAGVIEAKKAGVPLVEVEIQSGKYSQGLPENLPAPRRPLPFCQAIREAERGLIAAQLGGGVIKQRIARPGEGKSSGFRVL